MAAVKAYDVSGPNNVHALEHPTRFAPRLLAVPGSEGSFESDRSEFELVPGAKRSPVASGLTTPHSKVQSTNEREDEHERSQVEILGSGYESTPVSVRSNHGRGPPRTPGNRGISFRNGQVRSVRFGKDLVPRRPRGEWSRQNSIAEVESNGSNSSSPVDFSASARSLDVSARTRARYSVFPKGITLDERRTYEQDLIERFDRLEINKHVGDFWFIIDSIWMNRWINFVLGKSDPPGCITNFNLFEKDESLFGGEGRRRRVTPAVRPNMKVLRGLHKVRDYRAIHALVWYLLREMYETDGAPEICRWTSDIYSPEVVAVRKLRLEEETHTKAVYELRRFLTRIKENIAERDEEAERVADVEESTTTSGRRRDRRRDPSNSSVLIP